ncbi:MAG TPA: aldehyde dehydrogenase (NADP(+)), partial [Pirellulales bacterium]|nr:aldehyde dehydrogenase (NADP(+)) [Pirellulales bacterium]
AAAETGLARKPRLADVELPRTTGQLRQAAAAAVEGSWALPTIDTKLNIRSRYAPLGPVCVFGPNNFPFAFNGVGGGDFAAAIAAGNPVIAKANSSHPGTTRLLAEEARSAALEAELPAGTIQLIYRTSHADGQRLVADPRVGATAYTGSRSAGLKLKAAADAAGKPIYLELSSVNPVVILPGALAERGDKIAEEFAGSCLMGSGQFCTNPGLVVLLAGPATDAFLSAVEQRFAALEPTPLLSRGVLETLEKNLNTVIAAGAVKRVGGARAPGSGYRFANSLLSVDAPTFIKRAEAMQTEMFGNASLVVIAESVAQAAQVLERLEGNLTGTIYSATSADDAAYAELAPRLRPRVGRLLDDKMPTGVAVSPAMNHGGPYPATGHPGFTAVGIPAALRRFAMLECYDNVRAERLPDDLADRSPGHGLWRLIDGRWTQGDVA